MTNIIKIDKTRRPLSLVQILKNEENSSATRDSTKRLTVYGLKKWRRPHILVQILKNEENSNAKLDSNKGLTVYGLKEGRRPHSLIQILKGGESRLPHWIHFLKLPSWSGPWTGMGRTTVLPIYECVQEVVTSAKLSRSSSCC